VAIGRQLSQRVDIDNLSLRVFMFFVAIKGSEGTIANREILTTEKPRFATMAKRGFDFLVVAKN